MRPIGWFEQPARGDVTLHAAGCRHLKPGARPTLLQPSWHPQHVERPALQVVTVWTCQLCLRRVAALNRLDCST